MTGLNINEPSLDPEFLIVAYCNGYFPMATSRNGPIEWFSPDPRTIIPLDDFKVSRSLKQDIRKKEFEIRIDTAFEEVMRYCSDREDTWISEEIIAAYTKLNDAGFAHSVETWFRGSLVGGLYGVAIRGAFFGESMFSLLKNASKVALFHLVERMKAGKFILLDSQYMTEHLRSLGAIEIPRSTYLNLLSKALAIETKFSDWK
ncbi:MAG: leucyl/phenylalanyl-tRNA--protein transferase [Bacteroidetes bacterium]|nr:leucyl/phenylalanyl-tRNA--protein transferase [Bacteroidota bacterium]MCW5896938.1 leucyl/phenylalanyl-tRNA--protein transferase [Bacteroidota bacterium]